jgi:hypothetical protein
LPRFLLITSNTIAGAEKVPYHFVKVEGTFSALFYCTPEKHKLRMVSVVNKEQHICEVVC